MPFFKHIPCVLYSYQFGPPVHIELHPPAHRVPDVFDCFSEPGTIGTLRIVGRTGEEREYFLTRIARISQNF